MTSTDIYLLLTALASVLLLVALIVSRVRMHPLVALLIVCVGVGLATGMELGEIAKNITNGAGKTLGAVGVVIALGAMLGKILADAGITEQIANALLRHSSDRMIPWAMTLVAFIVGIPMFFEVGLVVMLPLVFSVARKLEGRERFKGSAYVYVGVPVIAALAAMHGMVPPHPGPLTAIAALKTSVGPTMLYGFIAALPAMVLAGPLYGAFIAPRMTTRPDQALLDQFTLTQKHAASAANPPGVALGAFAALLPALLMLVHALSETFLSKGSALAGAAAFVGNPIIAMLLGVLFAAVALVYARGGDAEDLRDAMGASLKPIAGIMLIIARRRLPADPDQREGRRCNRAPDAAVRLPAARPRLADCHAAVGVHRLRHGGHRWRRWPAGAVGRCRPRPQPAAAGAVDRQRLAVLQLRQPRRLLAGEGVVQHVHGRSDTDHHGGAVDRRIGGPGDGAGDECGDAAALALTSRPAVGQAGTTAIARPHSMATSDSRRTGSLSPRQTTCWSARHSTSLCR